MKRDRTEIMVRNHGKAGKVPIILSYLLLKFDENVKAGAYPLGG